MIERLASGTDSALDIGFVRLGYGSVNLLGRRADNVEFTFA